MSLRRGFLNIFRSRNARIFDSIMAKVGKGGDPEYLLRIVKTLGRPYQSELIRKLFLTESESLGGVKVEPKFEDLWFDYRKVPEPFFSQIRNTLRDVETDRIDFDLSTDLVLPWPWKQHRLDRALSGIGPDRRWGPWEYDHGNHAILAIMPLHIGFVVGGNHSIATGIITGRGRLPARSCVDLTEIYSLVTCDGRYYRLKATGRRFSKVRNPVFAAIFEIGRMMVETQEAGGQ